MVYCTTGFFQNGAFNETKKGRSMFEELIALMH